MGFCWKFRRLIRKVSRIGVKLDSVSNKVDTLRQALYEEIDDVHQILEAQHKLLLSIKFLLSKSGPISLLVLKEVTTTMSIREFVCALALPALAAPDTVSRKLILQKLGDKDAEGNPTKVGEPTEYIIVEPELSSLRSPEFQFPDKQKFTATLSSTDGYGNENEPRTQEFVVIDSIAPPADGEMGVLVVREIEVPDAPPTDSEESSTSSFYDKPSKKRH